MAVKWTDGVVPQLTDVELVGLTAIQKGDKIRYRDGGDEYRDFIVLDKTEPDPDTGTVTLRVEPA